MDRWLYIVLPSCFTDDACSRPLLRGIVAVTIETSAEVPGFESSNLPFGKIGSNGINHWRPGTQDATVTVRNIIYIKRMPSFYI